MGRNEEPLAACGPCGTLACAYEGGCVARVAGVAPPGRLAVRTNYRGRLGRSFEI